MKKLFLSRIFFILMLIGLLPAILGLCFPRSLEGRIFSSPFPYKNLGGDTVISCLDTKTNTVFESDIEEYLVGVLAAEMPASYEMEALKAQAVAARSYILSNMDTPNPKHPSANVCTDSTHCKAWLSEADAKAKWKSFDKILYWNKLRSAVDSTRGEYMVYDDQVVEAFFFASSGGKTENSEDVWGSSRPYLKSVESSGDTSSSDCYSTLALGLSDFKSKLQPFFSQSLGSDTPLQIGTITRTQGGSVAEIVLFGKPFKGTEIRSVFGLRSANFIIDTVDDKVIFKVAGYGHGVGMSQVGANYMAKSGQNYTEILSHYYTNIQIVKL